MNEYQWDDSISEENNRTLESNEPFDKLRVSEIIF